MKIPTVVLFALLVVVSIPSFAVAEKTAVRVSAGIDWHKGDVDAAFKFAKQRKKPLFLYWGAVWCPPCNQVKATVFNRHEFIEHSRFFVPVHLDGDSPNAQKIGARFKVRGYPTMILFNPDGTEITRLPGEVDSERYLQVLKLGMSASHSVKDTLRNALADGAALSADQWRLLAYYSWETDEQQLLGVGELPRTLQRLAAICPQADTAARLGLLALAAASSAKENVPPIDRAAAMELLSRVLADAHMSRDNMDVLANYAGEIVKLVAEPKSEARARLGSAWMLALQRLADDKTLSKADRIAAIDSEVALARLDTPDGPLAPELLQEVRRRVAEADRSTTDPYERQSVISNAGHALSAAGLLDESDALLKAELKRSHSPYYFMLSLADNARMRGATTEALSWYEKAYDAAKGPATRIQWGSTYLRGLLELAPDGEVRIEKAAGSIIREIGGTKNAFYERNRSALEKLGKKLVLWNANGQHEAVFQRIRKQLNGVCSSLPAKDPQRSVCQEVLVAGL
jgi:thioredoxin-related protein